jgi:protein gp37
MTTIPWTDITDNIFVPAEGGWYCQKRTTEFAHCYAETWNGFRGNKLPFLPLPDGRLPQFKIREKLISSWVQQAKPHKHFVMSMGDVFGDDVLTGVEFYPRSWHFQMLDGMAAAPKQTFQIVTKCPHIMLKATDEWLEARGLEQLPPNIWCIVTAGTQATADRFLPLLLQVRTQVRGISAEPLLQPVDFSPYLSLGIHWLIVGGESGTGARAFHLEWGRSLLGQCRNAGVSPFFKQAGANCWEEGVKLRLRDRKGENLEELPIDLQVREFPTQRRVA